MHYLYKKTREKTDTQRTSGANPSEILAHASAAALHGFGAASTGRTAGRGTPSTLLRTPFWDQQCAQGHPGRERCQGIEPHVVVK